jgi:hypothetical protein
VALVRAVCLVLLQSVLQGPAGLPIAQAAPLLTASPLPPLPDFLTATAAAAPLLLLVVAASTLLLLLLLLAQEMLNLVPATPEELLLVMGVMVVAAVMALLLLLLLLRLHAVRLLWVCSRSIRAAGRARRCAP